MHGHQQTSEECKALMCFNKVASKFLPLILKHLQNIKLQEKEKTTHMSSFRLKLKEAEDKRKMVSQSIPAKYNIHEETKLIAQISLNAKQ